MKLPRTQTDYGLLVLRASAVLLLIVYGWKKFAWLFPLISGRVAWSSWGFAAQIGKMGFPLPTIGSFCGALRVRQRALHRLRIVHQSIRGADRLEDGRSFVFQCASG